MRLQESIPQFLTAVEVYITGLMLAYPSRTDELTLKQGTFSCYRFADQNFNSWWGTTARKQTQTHHQQSLFSGPNFGNSPQTLCSLMAQHAKHE